MTWLVWLPVILRRCRANTFKIRVMVFHTVYDYSVSFLLRVELGLMTCGQLTGGIGFSRAIYIDCGFDLDFTIFDCKARTTIGKLNSHRKDKPEPFSETKS